LRTVVPPLIGIETLKVPPGAVVKAVVVSKVSVFVAAT